MVTRVILSVAIVLSSYCAAFGQQYVTKQEFDAAIEKISSQIAALGGKPIEEPTIEKLDERIAKLEANQSRLATTQQQQGVAIGQIARRDEAGNYHWQFNANSQPARDEFRKAIAETSPKFGMLIINNRMNRGEWIKVNGTNRYIAANDTEYFDVKPGTVTTELWGEQAKNWLIGLPNYRQSIDINDRGTVPIQRTIVYQQPIYTNPIGWVSAY